MTTISPWLGYPLAALLFAAAALYLFSRIEVQQPDGSWRPLLKVRRSRQSESLS